MAGLGVDQLLFLGLVHGGLVGRGEHVDRGSLGHLLQQGTRGAEVQLDLGIRILGFVALGDLLEGVGETGGGRNGDLGSLGGTGSKRQDRQGQQLLPEGDVFHGDDLLDGWCGNGDSRNIHGYIAIATGHHGSWREACDH